MAALIEEVRFARDSPLEGDGFEPSVPRDGQRFATWAIRSLSTHTPRESSGPPVIEADGRWLGSAALRAQP
jgi:hypothetical protein